MSMDRGQCEIGGCRRGVDVIDCRNKLNVPYSNRDEC